MDYNDLTINKYLQCVQLLEAVKTENEGMRLLALTELVEVLTGENVDAMEINKFADVSRVVSLLKEPIPHEGRTPDKYNFNGLKCRVEKDITRITMAQYIDYTNIMADFSADKLPDVLSVFIIPVGCEYGRGYDVAKLRESIANGVSIADANKFAFFLRRCSQMFADTLADCLRKREKKQAQQQAE